MVDMSKRVQINGVRISERHHAILTARADEHRRSISGEAAVLLEAALEQAQAQEEARRMALTEKGGESR